MSGECSLVYMAVEFSVFLMTVEFYLVFTTGECSFVYMTCEFSHV